MAHAVEDIQRHVRIYISVFATLAALTIITVGISYMHLTVGAAIALALVVATTKASLVALYFMHLIDEQKTIYWLLGLTALFFVFVMYMPSAWKVDEVKLKHSVWSVLPVEGSAKHGAAHGDGHGAAHGDDQGSAHGEEHGGGH